MQSRVADLIERCQDEIILESTLQINDELNSVFVRYERYTHTPLPLSSQLTHLYRQVSSEQRSSPAASTGKQREGAREC